MNSHNIFADLDMGLNEAAPHNHDAGNTFANAIAARTFILAGNATFTIRSEKTGARFTYRVRASEDGAVHFVALLNGPDNEGDFQYIGYVRRGVFFHGNKSRINREAPSVKAFAWAFSKIQAGVIPDTLGVWHEGRCGRCGRKLTVPESIEAGIGPECATRMN